jgi:hypothetical protein
VVVVVVVVAVSFGMLAVEDVVGGTNRLESLDSRATVMGCAHMVTGPTTRVEVVASRTGMMVELPFGYMLVHPANVSDPPFS